MTTPPKKSPKAGASASSDGAPPAPDATAARKASGSADAKPWSILPPVFRQAVERLKFASPTPIQSACLPKALAGESFRALAPTGTGKTLVYLLTAWQKRLEAAVAGPSKSSAGPGRPGTASASKGGGLGRTLILVPTRELGYQVSQMLRELDPSLAKGTVAALGGHDRIDQIELLGRGWSILVATPGRLLDLMQAGAADLRRLSLLVLDEFDKLVGMGFAEQIAEVLKQVPQGVQRILLSATDQEAGAAETLGLGALPAVAVEREPDSRVMEEAFYYLKSDKKKNDLLLGELATARGQVMVFTGNREKANHLNGLLKLRGFPSRVLHGRMPQPERAAAYQEFRAGRFKVLVATDLAARGLDMPEVDLIVNFDLPKHYKDYVHRTGRAARRGRAGRCVSYAGPHEYLPMRNLEAEFPGTLPVHPGFAGREIWHRDAKRIHDREVGKEERRDRIRKAQGLDED